LYYLGPKCLYRGEYKLVYPRALSLGRWWCVRVVFYEFFVPPYLFLASPFIVPRGHLGYRI